MFSFVKRISEHSAVWSRPVVSAAVQEAEAGDLFEPKKLANPAWETAGSFDQGKNKPKTLFFKLQVMSHFDITSPFSFDMI